MIDINKLSGIDKAAILYQTLGTKLASQLFKNTTTKQLNKIRRHMKKIGSAPFSAKKIVMEEFYFNFISEKFKPAEEDTKKPFDFMLKLSDEQIIYLVSTEKPRIIALTVAQLEVERQVNILQNLDPAIQPEVLTEMGDLDDIPLEGVVSIASELKEKSAFLPKKTEFSRGGGENLAGILSQMRPKDEKRFLEHLQKAAPNLVEEVKRHYFSFDDMMKLPVDILSDILKSVEGSDIAYALKGQPEEVHDKFIDCLPQRTQIILEDEIDLLEGPQPRRKVEASQKKIVDKAREVEKEGRFSLEDFMEEDMIE